MAGINRISDRVKGFTLVELSIVVLIITLLIGSLLVPLSTQVAQRNISDTQQRLAQIDSALIGFAIANGRFPCPAVSTGASTDSGVESFAVGGTAMNGNCSNFINGYVPGITLGLSNVDSQGFAVDAWGLQQNRIRYSISNTTVGGVANVFTAYNGMRNATIPAVGNPINTYLYVCASATGTTATACSAIAPPTPDPNALSRGDAVFVVYSLGQNAATTGGSSPNEAANLKSTTNTTPVFVSAPASNQAGVEFDDLLRWESRYSVVGQLTAAGQLP